MTPPCPFAATAKLPGRIYASPTCKGGIHATRERSGRCKVPRSGQDRSLQNHNALLLTVPSSGRTLSGGLDPAALYMPKRFFGAARNIEEGGSLTVLATALVETGSKMDDVIFEEFKGTGNMELVLDRKMSEKRIFPAVNMAKSGTRREELLLSKDELDAVYFLRKSFSGSMTNQEVTEQVMDLLVKTDNNEDFVKAILKLSNNK